MPERPVVIFDGDCVFCQRSVRFIHKHDAANALRFAARQSPAGARLLRSAGVDAPPNSIVLIDKEGTWLRSDAVLRIAARLGAPWAFARVFLLVPRRLRDTAYRGIAAIRHRLSPHMPACAPPDAALRAKFME